MWSEFKTRVRRGTDMTHRRIYKPTSGQKNVDQKIMDGQ